MSKNLRGIAVPGGVARSCFGEISKMTNVESVKKAFHKARIKGEKLLSQGKITWDEFADNMRDCQYYPHLKDGGMLTPASDRGL